ncbi:MAG: alanine racemase [Rhodobacteraceae bacterium]|nr:MAG: alanine racemase [Paracoccaceae bacterium]
MTYNDVDTPSVLIDLDIVEMNIQKYQRYCNSIGLNLRPHIKTHKIPALAKLQLAEGAVGITCQKISEAEAIISEGVIDDILLTYNIIGEKKLSRLLALAQRVDLSVVADNLSCITGLSEAFAKSDNKLRILVECDTGAMRCGVVNPRQAFDLATVINKLPGIKFGGLMTYPPVGKADIVNKVLLKTKDFLENNKIDVPVVSVGGSPDMWNADKISVATEYRVGTYIYNDRSLIERGTCELQHCALTVLATVVSTPTPERAVVDAGSKVLTSDLSGLVGYGLVVNYPHVTISNLSEEHGCLKSEGPTGLVVGQKIQIIPNHACVVSNMVDQVTFTRSTKVTKLQRVTARGKVW